MSQSFSPYEEPPQRKPGMSGTAKVLLGLGIGCGLLLLLCCGGVFIVGFGTMRSFQRGFSEDPVIAREITQRITDIEIPDDLDPKGSMDLKAPFFGTQLALFAFYGDEDQHNVLVVGEISSKLMDESNVEAQFKETMRNSGRGGPADLQITDSETYRPRINGEEAKFRIANGKAEDSGDTFWQVQGVFRGHNGPAFLFAQMKSPPATKEQMMEIINSMSTPEDRAAGEPKPPERDEVPAAATDL